MEPHRRYHCFSLTRVFASFILISVEQATTWISGSSTSDDQTCIRVLAAGGWHAEMAASVAYRRYAPAFRSWLRAGSRGFSTSGGEEIVQDTFLNIIGKDHLSRFV